jgi:hypothetical protein
VKTEASMGARTIEVVGQPCASAGVLVPLSPHGLRFESVFSHLANPTANKKAPAKATSSGGYSGTDGLDRPL